LFFSSSLLNTFAKFRRVAPYGDVEYRWGTFVNFAMFDQYVAIHHGLTHLLHSELHWLDVADRVTYKLGMTVYKCLHGQAPDYLSELCTPVAQVAEDSVFVPPAAIYSLFHGFSSIGTAVAPSLSLDKRQLVRKQFA